MSRRTGPYRGVEITEGGQVAREVDRAGDRVRMIGRERLLELLPAWPVFLREVAAFLEPERTPLPAKEDLAAVLSPRELEVLRLAAEGHDNDGIARALTLSVRTVERHLSNVYTKLDIQGKSARTAAVARLLTGYV